MLTIVEAGRFVCGSSLYYSLYFCVHQDISIKKKRPLSVQCHWTHIPQPEKGDLVLSQCLVCGSWWFVWSQYLAVVLQETPGWNQCCGISSCELYQPWSSCPSALCFARIILFLRCHQSLRKNCLRLHVRIVAQSGVGPDSIPRHRPYDLQQVPAPLWASAAWL